MKMIRNTTILVGLLAAVPAMGYAQASAPAKAATATKEATTKAATATKEGATQAATATKEATTKAATATKEGATKAATATEQGATKAATATKEGTTKAASAAKAEATHSTKGKVKSVDATSLVITGAKGADMTFVLNSATTKTGTPAVGANVQVRYKTEAKQNIATAVTVAAAKK